MEQFSPYLTFRLDISKLEGAFKFIYDKLRDYDLKMVKLQQFLDRNAGVNLEDLKNEINLLKDTMEENDAKTKRSIDEKLNSTKTEFEKKLNDLRVSLEQKLMDSGLQNGVKDALNSVNDLSARVVRLESDVKDLLLKTGDNENCLNQVVDHLSGLNSPAGVANKQPSAQNRIDRVKNSVETVNMKFDSIFGALSSLPGHPDFESYYPASKIPTTERFSDPSLRFTGRNGFNSGSERTAYQDRLINNTLPHEITQPHRVDFDSMRPYPNITLSWKDQPRLPSIFPFRSLSEPIEFTYKLMPPLQAYLNAVHDHLIESEDAINAKINRNDVEKMFEKFRQIVKELANKINDINECLGDLATRDEINDALECISFSDYTQTAIGVVRCMTCGHEISQVTGAMTPTEAIKTLGKAPTSYVNRTKSGLSVQYGKDVFESPLVESPRSIRTPRQPVIKVITKRM